MVDVAQLRSEFNRIGIEFLNTDIDTALTMANMALAADPDSEKRSRNLMNARHAYYSVIYFSRVIQFTPKQATMLESKLTRLRSALDQLDEPRSEHSETAEER